jgi:hypothetical protein
MFSSFLRRKQSSKAVTDSADNRPVVFMHIPRTAGTAVRVALLAHWPDQTYRMLMRPDELERAWREDPWSYAGFRLITGHFGTEFIKRFRFPVFCATLVRDPVERVLSNYLFWKEIDLAGLPASLASQVAYCRSEPLAKLLQSDSPVAHARLINQQAKQFAARSSVEPGAAEIVYGDDLLDCALTGAKLFDFIGFQDELEPSLNLLFAKLGTGVPPPVARREINATASSPENLALRADSDLRRLIRQRNEIDLALYEALRLKWALAAGQETKLNQ